MTSFRPFAADLRKGFTSFAAALILLPFSALAEDAPAAGTQPPPADSTPAPAGPQASPGTTNLGTVEVTGSRIRRTDMETAAPVTTISRQQIERTGATSLSDLLKVITSNENGLSQEQTLGFAAGSSNINLRGLGAQYTLVLLNGRRIAPYGRPNVTSANIEPSVNIDSIPVGAIERVEILNNGGSAIYGSDAIGGVVNVITKKNYNGLDVGAYYGETSHGDGQTKNVSLTAGSTNNGYSGLFFVNYLLTNGIRQGDRDISSSSDQRRLGGIDYSSGVGDPGSYLFTDNATPANTLQDNLCPPAQVSGGVCRTNRNAFTELEPPQHRLSMFASVNKDILTKDNFTLTGYMDALINKSTVTTTYYPTPVSTANDGALVGGMNNPFTTAFLAAESAKNPGVTIPPQDVFIRYDFTEVGPRTDRYEDFQDRYTLGFKGSFFNDWSYDVAGLYTSDTNDDLGSNYVSQPLTVAALTTGIPVVDATGAAVTEFLNPYGGGNTPEIISALKIRLNTHAVSNIRALDATVGGPIVKFSDDSQVSLAVGAERRLEQFENDPDSQQSGSGVVALSTGTPVAGARSLTSVYAEVDGKFRNWAELQVAARHESYSDFGSITKPKFALKVTPIKELVIRAGLDKGFRAPSLADLFAAQSTSFTNGFVDTPRCPGGVPANGTVPASDCDRSGLFKVTVGGSPTLKPEQSRSFYYGFVAEPIPAASFGFDVFNIRVDNVITTLPAQLLIDSNVGIVRGPSAGGGVPGPILNIFNGFINGGFLQINGFDADVSYTLPGAVLPRELGKLKSTVSASYIDKYKYSDPNTPEASYAGSDAFGLALARVKAYMQFDYDITQWTAVLRANYVGGYNDDFVSGNHVGSFTSWDGQGQFSPSFVPGMKLTVGINNLFDRMPPFNPGAGAYSAAFAGYDPSLYSAVGRFVYGSVNFSF